jgi:hypothetical protein
MYHLTYKGHIQPFELLNLCEEKLGKLKAYSIVWEKSDKDIQYDHTHFLIWLEEAADVRDSGGHLMDYKDVHPNVQSRSSKKWWWHVYKVYHWKAPVGPNKDEPLQYPGEDEPQDMAAEQVDIALAAPTLADACKELEIVPKSVADVNCLRQNNKRKWTPLEIKYTEFDPVPEIDDWFDRAKVGDRGKGLLVVGGAFLGKTQYIKWKAGQHAVYMKGRMNWQKWLDNPNPSYLIIDDMSHEFIREQRKNFLGSDEFETNPKYGKITTMKPLPTIVIDNTGWPFDDYDESVWEVVRLTEKVYGRSPPRP